MAETKIEPIQALRRLVSSSLNSSTVFARVSATVLILSLYFCLSIFESLLLVEWSFDGHRVAPLVFVEGFQWFLLSFELSIEGERRFLLASEGSRTASLRSRCALV